ncbi:MAG: NAD(P)H-hydrate dehydratase [Bacteroidetes bacterium]|nr:NAD(P)H-hydrate dehydratase [Bacteroidota bacterium]
MKILNSSQIREADAYTISHEPVSSINLMERAAGKCFDWISERIEKTKNIKVICGLGNNGGDGLVISRLLQKSGYNVEVIVLRYSEKCSEDFKKNEDKIKKLKKNIITEVKDIADLPQFSDDSVIIDAIFGSGLSKPVEGFIADVIEKINASKNYIISIDLPSGLFSEENFSNNPDSIVKADVTITFQVPKLAFLLPENYPFVGEWTLLNIGLNKEYIESLNSPYYFVEDNDVRQMLKIRGKFSHKGSFGHALLFSGSYGKAGAVVLGAKACLRSGAGLLTAHIPEIAYQIVQAQVPEAIVSIDESEKYISNLPEISKYDAIAIGPGIDIKDETQKLLKLLIQNSSIPLIIDADALNILSENKTWFAFIPKYSILTPHPKEFERLAGKPENDNHRLQLQKELSVKYCLYIVYKGAYTTISTPEGKFYFNSTGNPGMATGGSGDVLTGILLGLKASGYSCIESCIIGTYLHGLAGDIAKDKKGEDSLIAGDIVDNISEAFKFLKNSI